MSIRDLKVWIPLTSWDLCLPNHLRTLKRYIPPPSWKSPWLFCCPARSRGESLPVNFCCRVWGSGGKGLEGRAKQVAKGRMRMAAQSWTCNETTAWILHVREETSPSSLCRHRFGKRGRRAHFNVGRGRMTPARLMVMDREQSAAVQDHSPSLSSNSPSLSSHSPSLSSLSSG